MTDSLIIERNETIGIMTLNRPAALNTLSLELIQKVREQLNQWQQDPNIRLICIKGEGKKGFCAGGDVKALAQQLDQESAQQFAYDFFWNEYHLDYEIHVSPKPVIVVGHGITMGGGIGLLAGATCRVVTETTLMAMPEITIGLFTDVGASYFLPRMPHEIGLFLGLTATRFSGRDALYLGLADVLLKEEQILPWLKDCQQVLSQSGTLMDRSSLIRLAQKRGGQLDSDLDPSLFEVHAQWIQSLVSGLSLDEIRQKFSLLKAEKDTSFPWDLSPFFHGSPTSAHLIFEQYRRGKFKTLQECFEMEFNLSLMCCRQRDFKEGVRALLIDKDKTPRWSPPHWSEVTVDQITPYFELHQNMWRDS